MDTHDLTQLAKDCQSLEAQCQTLLLSTLNLHQHPEISYAPYLKRDGKFYIFISELAAHTQNLIAHSCASLLFIKDEQDSQNMFARERLTYQCSVSLIDKEYVDYEPLLDQMEAKFGNIMQMLRGLADFRLFEFTPEKGTYVVGFGRAYEVSPETMTLTHIDADKLAQEKRR